MTDTAPEPGGRREANRQRTRAAIIEAVRSIGEERGLSGVTIEDVSERADVSRRTFHNYFPNVQAVVAAAMIDLLSPVGDRFLQRPAAEHPLESARIALQIPDELLTWLGFFPEGDEHIAMKIQMESDHQIDTWMRGLMAQRLGPDAVADEVYVRVLTATLHGAFAAAEAAWAEQTGRAISPDAKRVFTDTLARGLTLAMDGFSAPAGGTPQTTGRPTTPAPPSDPVRGSTTKG